MPVWINEACKFEIENCQNFAQVSVGYKLVN